MLDPASVHWDDWLLLALQVFTLVFLIIYVWKTWEMASATREAAAATADAAQEAHEARMDALAPGVVLYFDPTEIHVAQIVIENVGRGTAYDVRFEFDSPLQCTLGKADPNDFFRQALPIVPPGYRIIHTFDSWPQYFGAGLPVQYRVRVTYRGAESGGIYEMEHVLDTAPLKHRLEVRRKTMHDLVEQVERLGRNVADLVKKKP